MINERPPQLRFFPMVWDHHFRRFHLEPSTPTSRLDRWIIFSRPARGKRGRVGGAEGASQWWKLVLRLFSCCTLLQGGHPSPRFLVKVFHLPPESKRRHEEESCDPAGPSAEEGGASLRPSFFFPVFVVLFRWRQTFFSALLQQWLGDGCCLSLGNFLISNLWTSTPQPKCLAASRVLAFSFSCFSLRVPSRQWARFSILRG